MIVADLAIVGGGPAGAAAALRAMQLAPDLRVVLCDASVFPRDKTCGDGIGPEGLDVLERLGVAHILDDAPRIARLRVVAPSGREVKGVAPRPGVVIRRKDFDDRLYRAALARGARPLHHRVRAVHLDATGVRLDDRVRARWVIGADGANSMVARTAGFRRPAPGHTGLAMRGYAACGDLDELMIEFVGDHWPAYAWAFPIGDGSANVGWGPFDTRSIHHRRDLQLVLERRFGHLGLDHASLRAHRLPLSTARPVPTRGRVLLAGDAANLVHPLTGEGIYYALLSGAMAAAAIVVHPDDPASVYRRALRARLGTHLRHTDIAATLLRSSLGIEVAVAAAADDVGVLATLAEFALGTGRLDGRMVKSLTTAWWRHRPLGPHHRAERRRGPRWQR